MACQHSQEMLWMIGIIFYMLLIEIIMSSVLYQQSVHFHVRMVDTVLDLTSASVHKGGQVSTAPYQCALAHVMRESSV